MLAEEDLQRRELERLLSTAKDKDRQDLILKAIHALDEQEAGVSAGRTNSGDSYTSGQGSVNAGLSKPSSVHLLSPSTHASLFLGENMPVVETVTMTAGGSARMRPMSARRRLSVPNLLDAIPEQTLPKTKVNRNEEIIMSVEDIAEVVASSFDRRFPPKSIFKQHNHYHHQSQQHQQYGGGNSTSTSNDAIDSLNGNGATVASADSVINSTTVSSDSRSNHSANIDMKFARRGSHPSRPTSSGGDGGNSSSDLLLPVHSVQQPSSVSGTTGLNTVHGWVSSGIVPQFLNVSFFEKWEIKKVEVFCNGIESLCMQICASTSSTIKSTGSNVSLIEMIATGKG